MGKPQTLVQAMVCFGPFRPEFLGNFRRSAFSENYFGDNVRTYFDIMAHRSCNFLTEWGMDCRFVLYKSFLKLTTCESLKCFHQLFHECSRLRTPLQSDWAPFSSRWHAICIVLGRRAFAGLRTYDAR